MGAWRGMRLWMAICLVGCDREGAVDSGEPPREPGGEASAAAVATASGDALQRHLQEQARAMATSRVAHANRQAPAWPEPIGDVDLQLSLGEPPPVTSAPRVRGAMPATGKLPPEAIQRVVRGNFGLMRKCYDDALATQPKLKGRVSVQFVIARDGSVGAVSTSGEISDAAMLSCLEKVFWKLVFPTPDGGIVKVTYPIHFTP